MNTLCRAAAVVPRRMRLLATCCIMLAAAGLQAETYYVSLEGSDSNSGAGGWENALQSISTAIVKAVQSGDTIWLSNGTHYLAGTVTVALDITLRGYTTNAAETIIDGGYPDRTNRCLILDDPGALVRDLTIQHGFYNVAAFGGGGVYVNGGTVSNCIVQTNYCQRYGAGVHIAADGLVIDSLISNNRCTLADANARGGGLYIDTTGRVERCRIAGNTAHRGGGVYVNSAGMLSGVDVYDNRSHEYGGGVYVYGKANLLNCNLTGNSATGGAASAAGGGFYAYSAEMEVSISGGSAVSNSARDAAGFRGQALTEIRGVDIRDNTASTYGGGGYGGIYHNCTFTGNKAYHGGGLQSPHGVYDCTLTGNTALIQGGGMYVSSAARVVVSNCVLVGNATAANAGGGIFIKNAPPETEIVDCLISNNYHKTTVYGGGGIGCDGLDVGKILRIHRCVIVDNIATNHGGGVWIWSTAGGTVDLRNNLITGNSAKNEGGGVYLDVAGGGGLVENCTIMSNTALTAGKTAGLWGPDASPLVAVNSIVHDNADVNGTVWNYPASAELYFTNCCVYPTPTHTDNVITSAPAVVDAGSGNFRLSSGSPCINRGLYRPWMDGASDLDRRPRIDRLTKSVDMGCYEYIFPGILFTVK